MSLAGNTQRIVQWEELPASVREIPEGKNPLADGLLMRHQQEWLKLCAENDLTVCPKGRRTGITYATALDSAITAASKKSAGGDNVYYIGDTKEKGLEFIGYCAHMAKVVAISLAENFSGIEVFLFEDQQPDGSSKNITAYRIRFATGFEIVALSSNPANIRGLQGIVVIDEAAFHQNVQAVIDAATALIIWGGKIRIISTHNGNANPFNELIKDAYAGLNMFKVYFVSFDDAVANGLYERVCFVKGWDPTPEGKEAWYKKVRGAYSNRDAMREELDGIPREGNGVAIAGALVENCMHEKRPVIRLALEDEFALKSKPERKTWCEQWIKQHLDPVLKLLDKRYQHVYGEDFARHGDFSIITPMAIMQDLTRYVPFIIEMKNVPTRQQQQVLWHMIRNLPKFSNGAMDATGNGATIAEYTAGEFGHDRIDQVMLNNKWYRENMGSFKQAFEDQKLDLPEDVDIKNDIRSLQLIDGIIKLPSLKTQDTKNKEFKRHGDAAIALALAWYASQQDIIPVSGFIEVPKASRQEGSANDDDYSIEGAGGW